MTEAFLNQISKTAKAFSAGTAPDKEIHPQTIQIMEEVGIDSSQQKTKPLSLGLLKKADKIVLMDSDLLKDFPVGYSQKVEVWETEKLFGKPVEKARKVRDSIRKRVVRLEKKLLREQ